MKDMQIYKLRVVTRRDSSIGYQAVQAGHAAIQYQHEHTESSLDWDNNSNYLIFLTVDEENHLERLIANAQLKGITVSIFREPDLNNEITAVAFEPCDESRKLLGSTPMMGKK